MNALEQIEAQLRASVVARAGTAAQPAPGRRRARGRRHIAGTWSRGRLVALACVAVVAAAVLVGLGLTNIGGGASPSPAVAAVMQRFARIAGSGPSLVPRAGQYLSVRSVSDYHSIAEGKSGQPACIFSAVDHRHVWIGANGSGLLRETTGPTKFTTARGRARCESMFSRSALAAGTSNLWFADDCFSLGPGGGDLQSLSTTDPKLLLAQMRRIEGGPHTPAEDLIHVGDFLQETDASPALRANLYRAAALIPGIQLLGPVRDHFGLQPAHRGADGRAAERSPDQLPQLGGLPQLARRRPSSLPLTGAAAPGLPRQRWLRPQGARRRGHDRPA
jgi:hypothetical protein